MKEFLEYLKTEKHKAGNTLIAYERDIKAFESFLSDNRAKYLMECSESDAIAYVMEMNNDSKSKATINRKVSALRTFYEHKMIIGEIKSNPFDKIKSSRTDNRQIDFLTVEETEKLISLPDNNRKGIRDKALMEFMYGTGARVTEVVRLKIEDINLRMSIVTLKDSNDESRIVPLGRYALDAMRKYLQDVFPSMKGRTAEPDDYVFINFRGEVLSRQGIWKILKDYGSEMGIEERMTPQILRDSFAVHILQNGGDLKSLQELMGFDDMSVGIAYLAVTEIHVRDVYARCHPRSGDGPRSTILV